MRRLSPIIERMLHRRAATTPTAPLPHAAHPAHAPGATPSAAVKARRLAEAAERESALGRYSISNRLAAAAVEVDRASAPAAEAFARLRLAQGDPAGALAAIDVAAARTPALRLLRAAALVRLGRKDEAHHDLLQWSRFPSAPEEARLMLALLEWEIGDAHAAALALLRNTRRREEPRSLALLTVFAAGTGRREQAAIWAARIGTMSGALAPRRFLAATLAIPAERLPDGPAAHEVETLAVELRRSESVIPSLVAALEAHPQREAIELLLGAIDAVLPLLGSEPAAIEAAARLELLLGDERSARERIRSALERYPMHAGLALVARRTASLTRAHVPSRSDVLATIPRRQPGAAAQERAA